MLRLLHGEVFRRVSVGPTITGKINETVFSQVKSLVTPTRVNLFIIELSTAE